MKIKTRIKTKFVSGREGQNKGRKAWNSGLTKETDKRIKKLGETYSKRFKEGKIKLSGLADPEYISSDKHKLTSSIGGRKSAAKQIRRSQNEIYFAELCKSKFDNILCNENMFNNWDADVILVDLKIAVLWNGLWHYKDKLKQGHSLKQVQSRDKIREDQIRKCGYSVYVIKDLGKANKKFVEQQYSLFCAIIGV